MENPQYFATIHSIKADIDSLDEAFWSIENPTEKDMIKYNQQRMRMCDKLEATYKA